MFSIPFPASQSVELYLVQSDDCFCKRRLFQGRWLTHSCHELPPGWPAPNAKLKRAAKGVHVREIPLKRGVSPYQGNTIHPLPLVGLPHPRRAQRPSLSHYALPQLSAPSPSVFPALSFHATPPRRRTFLILSKWQGKGDGLVIQQCCHYVACVIWSRRHNEWHVHTLCIQGDAETKGEEAEERDVAAMTERRRSWSFLHTLTSVPPQTAPISDWPRRNLSVW